MAVGGGVRRSPFAVRREQGAVGVQVQNIGNTIGSRHGNTLVGEADEKERPNALEKE